MKICNYTLSINEEEKLKYVFSKLQANFPSIKFSFRSSIIGIGEPNQHLMVYFGIKEELAFVKFKNQNPIALDSDVSELDVLIEKTIYTFSHNQYPLKKTPANIHNTQSYSVDKSSNYHEIQREQYISRLQEILNNIDDNISLRAFCSKRLNNVLQSHNIFTVEDIKKTPIDNIVLWQGLGLKSLEELLSILAKLVPYSSDKINANHLLKNLSSTNFSKADLILYRELPYIKNLFKKQNTINEETFPEHSLGKTIYMLEKLSHSDFSINFDFSNNEKIISTYSKQYEKFNLIYSEMIEFFICLADARLNDREKRIIFRRIGLDCEPMTLAQIGILENLTRERIRQIILKAKRKLKLRPSYKYNSIKANYIKLNLIKDLKQSSIEPFILYLIDIDEIAFLRDFVCDVLLDIDFHSLNFNDCLVYRKQTELELRQKTSFNDKVEKLIFWADDKTHISFEEWTNYQKQRTVGEHEESISGVLEFDNIIYQYESNMEKNVLLKFLQNQTFQQIKTQSLTIQLDNCHVYYPDFICLTHDNHLVIVEIKPVQKMCEQKNIIKFNALEDYCNEHGYGYLVIDDKLRSFNHIATENREFNTRILSTLPLHGSLGFNKYKQIYIDTHAKITDLLWLVINDKIAYALPFELYNRE